MKVKKVVGLLLSSFRLDRNEVTFLKEFNKDKRAQSNLEEKQDAVLIQMPMDYWQLVSFMYVSRKFGLMRRNVKTFGYWPYVIYPEKKDESRKAKILTHLEYFLKLHKWKKLYSVLGIHRYVTLSNNNEVVEQKANQDFLSLRSKGDVLSLSFNGIYLGDLIYDTYLRFRASETLDLSDHFLYEIICKSYLMVDDFVNFFEKNEISLFLTSYSSYIHHGVAVRVAIFKDVKVLSNGNKLSFFKELSKKDYFHTISWREYKKKFDDIVDKREAIKVANEQLIARFSGGIDKNTAYMKKSAYSLERKAVDNLSQCDGVIFLHDFFDSPHCWGDMLFADFWEWIVFTLSNIDVSSLKVAIKPHPNGVEDNLAVLKKLKKKFPNFIWLTADTPNNQIFESGIKFGISVYGTVLYELAYHDIVAVSAGEHPGMDFSFSYNPRTVEEYRNYLKKLSKLQPIDEAKKNALAFYYMYSSCNDDAIAPDSYLLSLRDSLDHGSSTFLRETLAI